MLSENEELIVVALDCQYQKAVKENDIDTMDRLLADDFVLLAQNRAAPPVTAVDPINDRFHRTRHQDNGLSYGITASDALKHSRTRKQLYIPQMSYR